MGARGNEEHQALRPSDTNKEMLNEENQTAFETSMKWLSLKRVGHKRNIEALEVDEGGASKS